MPELLLEVGCEELPAGFLPRAVEDLRDAITSRLAGLGLGHEDPVTACTPRRLIVSIPDLVARQEDEEKTFRGPAAKAAYDASGAPTKALEGFCRGQGVAVSSAFVEGDYVWVCKQVTGRLSSELLVEVLPAAIRSLTFDKTMRWAGYRMRFARPIRWILACFDGDCVPFEIEGVASGLLSRGHRFMAPDEFSATTFVELREGLRERFVEPDWEKRRDRIVEGARAVAAPGFPVLNDDLVKENTNLTEWPDALLGEFDERFLSLPEPVLTTVMAKHEKMFPVLDKSGITNKFVSIRNGGEEETVRKGNSWVLGNRFGDAQFFYDEDKKKSLDEFLALTERITFQADLGSVRKRADRLSELAGWIAEQTGASPEGVECARQAGLYAKADLSTGLVSEIAALQGFVGGEYARREGHPEEVWMPIWTQYYSAEDVFRGKEPLCYHSGPASHVSLAVQLADQADKLACYLGLGITASGSSDPYGLRRATAIMLEIAHDWKEQDLNIATICSQAFTVLESQGIASKPLSREKMLESLAEMARQRVVSILFTTTRPDHVQAALGADPESVFKPKEVRGRIELIGQIATNIPLVQTLTRPLNIVSAAEKKGIEIGQRDDAKLDSPEGVALAHALDQIQANAEPVGRLKQLAPAIHSFFENTMIMAEDPTTRNARLALLKDICTEILKVGDVSKLVQEG